MWNKNNSQTLTGIVCFFSCFFFFKINHISILWVSQQNRFSEKNVCVQFTSLFCNTALKSMDWWTKKLMTMHKPLHLNDDTYGLYINRKDDGRRIISIKWLKWDWMNTYNNVMKIWKLKALEKKEKKNNKWGRCEEKNRKRKHYTEFKR